MRRFLIVTALTFTGQIAYADTELPASNGSVSPPLDRVAAYLQEHAYVVDASYDGDSRDEISTHLEPFDEGKQVMLTYRRTSFYEGDQPWMERRQVIHYTVPVGDLDPESVRINEIEAQIEDERIWVVTLAVREGAPLIPYTNVIDTRTKDSGKNVMTSSSQVREIALGYFKGREHAQEFVKRVRAWLSNPTETTAN